MRKMKLLLCGFCLGLFLLGAVGLGTVSAQQVVDPQGQGSPGPHAPPPPPPPPPTPWWVPLLEILPIIT